MKLLENKVAIVTGGGSGIGAATALLYAKEGAKLIVSDINAEHCNAIVAQIKATGGEAFAVIGDVSDPAVCKSLVDTAVAQYGKIDVAFNNAGIGGESNFVGDMSIEGWNKIIAINLSSVFYCTKYEIEAMLKTNGGAIVNMASILGQVGFATAAGYVAAKHGVVGLTQTAAMEYSAKGIRINAVGPGFIDTPLLSNMDKAVKDQLVSLHPIGRLGTAEEVAELVLWLSTEKASFVTGSYYPIDGAYLTR